MVTAHPFYRSVDQLYYDGKASQVFKHESFTLTICAHSRRRDVMSVKYQDSEKDSGTWFSVDNHYEVGGVFDTNHVFRQSIQAWKNSRHSDVFTSLLKQAINNEIENRKTQIEKIEADLLAKKQNLQKVMDWKELILVELKHGDDVVVTKL